MLRLPLHSPAKQSWHLKGRFVYPVADSGTREKIASGTSRHHGQAIQRLVMARRPRNDFRGSISGTAVLRLVSPQDLGLILGGAVLDRDVLAQSSGSMG